ncbi:hypothetical protein A1O3_01901 [Capronia epimyces CBS 606.96]|uniref:Ketoreductase domain-containing protein n=1 Tax=Capronia epimyces CBS 606.96 TaxID=1182542 RepID=W9Y7P2_9EURO|nr:uncharacterized protein A1O3_01901 [Capronia epimyces CBS 606.96]EXJ88837.1 hypothetical protein A1O3_01901 [Capronia epimyces CBS 606.96]
MSTATPHKPIPARLAGKVALITGAAGNIGSATAHRFLQEGAKLALIDLDAAQLQRTEQALVATNPRIASSVAEHVLRVVADVTDEESIKRAVQETVDTFARLDTAFLCAGASYTATSIFDTDLELYDRLTRINSRSAFVGIKHAAAAMRDLGQGGSIILASSVSGLRGAPGMTVYAASKFALRGMCLSLVAELGQYGIRINTIHPCGVNTPMFRQTWTREQEQALLKTVPLGRWAEVEDVAAVVSFLASDDAQFLTGGALKVDGGMVCM